MDLSSTLRAWLSHEWLVLRKACYRYTNREKLLRLRYKEKFGKEPDLENPQTLNEKVMWLMLHADDRRWSELADKYRVREYVKSSSADWDTCSMSSTPYGIRPRRSTSTIRACPKVSS